MDVIFIVLAVWVLFSIVFAEIMPVIFEFLGYALAYVLKCIGVALAAVITCLLLALYRAVRWCARKCWRGIAVAFVFLAILMQEWWRGPACDDEYEGENAESAGDDKDKEPAARDPYQDAIDLLGLKPGFNRAALNRAYKQAMKHAHPDAGGSTRKAQAVNQARDFLKRARGWA